MVNRRVGILCVLALLLAGIPIAGTSAASSHAKKKTTCKVVTKTVKGKKKRQRVCTTRTVVTVVLPTSTSTPVPPTATDTPGPSPTATATSTATTAAPTGPTSTPTPIPTPTQVQSDCDNLHDCQMALLGLLNELRSRWGVEPLTFSLSESTGVPGCMGADGHTLTMIGTGAIWYRYPGDNPDGPTNPASFPNDICGWNTTVSAAAENVGAASGRGNELNSLRYIYNQWLKDDPHSLEACTRVVGYNSVCNITNPRFTAAGISIVTASYQGFSPGYWVTVHFTG